MTVGCSVVAGGRVVESSRPAQRVEMTATEVQLLGACDPKVLHSHACKHTHAHMHTQVRQCSESLYFHKVPSVVVSRLETCG